MRKFFRQFSALIGAGIAAACCLGVPLVLSALGTVGLGFIIHDAYLLPLFAGFVSWNLWTIFASARRHELLPAFWLAAIGGLVSCIGLGLLVSGSYPHTWPVIAGLALLAAGSLWDFVAGRRVADSPRSVRTGLPAGPARNAVTGAAISLAAAGIFYEIYNLAEAGKEPATGAEIACWGINACKGKTACTTAFNACTGQNACKGKGYLNVSATDCAAKGGKPLAGSEADPTRG